MSRKGHGVFELTEDEINHILMADNSDDEDGLQLDEQDQRFLTQDDDQGLQVAEIEDSTPRTREQSSEPSTSAAEPVREKYRTCQPVFKWTQHYIPNVFPDVKFSYGKVQILPEEDTSSMTPFEIFKCTTNFDVLVQHITAQSVRYAHQNGREFAVEPEEMKAFLGMNLVMGYHVLPSLRDYWSTKLDMAVPFIANIMPRHRFEDILRNLHFCNNEDRSEINSPEYDRAYKIRPIMDHLNIAFQNALNNTKTQSIDEHMIKFKGHNAMKQYIKNKPVKWGFKLWCRCDAATGYLYEFNLYTGKRSGETGTEYGLGESVVLQLTRKL